jgi:hypothetical protein
MLAHAKQNPEGSGAGKAKLELACVLDFGVVAMAGSQQETVMVRNPSSVPMCVGSWWSSCECLTIVPGKLQVEANDAGYIRLKLDLSEEPDFQGDLSIKVKGFASPAQLESVIEFDALASVVPAHKLAHLSAPAE